MDPRVGPIAMFGSYSSDVQIFMTLETSKILAGIKDKLGYIRANQEKLLADQKRIVKNGAN